MVPASLHEAQRYVRTRPAAPAVEADEGYDEDFFRRDSVWLQGYVDGYDPRLEFDSGILYLENEISRQDYPTVVPIRPDGSFQCKFVLQHPVCQDLVIHNNWIPFYAEPGDTITLYLDWEDLLARSRARDSFFPLSHTAYMGKKAGLSYLAMTLSQHFNYPYDKLMKAQKTLTPAQFQEQLQPTIAQWQQQADSLCRLYAPSKKAVQLTRNQIAMQTGYTYLEYQTSRSYYARQDSTNQALKVQPDASYYSFLKEIPLNEPSLLANRYISVFINRFEYMDPLNAAYKVYARLPNTETFKALPDDEKRILLQTAISEAKDSIAGSLCGTASPLLWQVARVRDLRYTLPEMQNRRDAERLIGRLEQTVTHPYLQATAREMLDELCPETEQASYRLPEGKATDIFRRIIAPHSPPCGQGAVRRLLGHHLRSLPGRHTGDGRPAQTIPQPPRIPVRLHHQRKGVAPGSLYGLCGETSERGGLLPPVGHGLQIHAPALPLQRHPPLRGGGERRQHLYRRSECPQPSRLPETTF